MFKEIGKMLGDLQIENDKLKSCLIEIKKIANYSFNLSTSELMAKLEQILQKINECEGVK